MTACQVDEVLLGENKAVKKIQVQTNSKENVMIIYSFESFDNVTRYCRFSYDLEMQVFMFYIILNYFDTLKKKKILKLLV